MRLSVLNAGLADWPIQIGIATVTNTTSFVQHERLTKVENVNGRFVVTIAGRDNDETISFAQASPGDSSLWLEQIHEPMTGERGHNPNNPCYCISGLITEHIDCD